MSNPACFTPSEWAFYTAGENLEPGQHCLDCTPAYQIAMQAQGRCQRAPIRRVSIRERILHVLQSVPSCGTSYIARKLGEPEHNVRQALAGLQKAGKVTLGKNYQWRLCR